MKHTQGPWKFDASTRFFEIVGADGRNILSSIYADDRSDDAFNDSTDRANAHLIAAAPDMLEELEQLCEALNDSVLSTGSNTMDEEILYNIRKIIKKAKGGS